jgi:Protein of unknown function DUF262
MKVKKDSYKVGNLATNWTNRTLRANPEYQRGLVWTMIQKQRLIDSVFRGYPLPSFYFRSKEVKGPDGSVSSIWEIIDGQQRIEALAGYHTGAWPALESDDPKLSLPDGVLHDPCPWGGRTFAQLTPPERARFEETEVPVLVVTETSNDDEIRDLFIRLQAGTALSRQQIRDAWPGPIGPFVEALAGRGKKTHPAYQLFSWLDRRGTRKAEESEEGEDEYVDDRQTCAQLLALFFAREKSSDGMPSLNARALDDMYHQHTSFDPDGQEALALRTALDHCESILIRHPHAKNAVTKKSQLFSLFLLLHDLSRSPKVKLNSVFVAAIGKEFWAPSTEAAPTPGKITTSTSLEAHYSWCTCLALDGADAHPSAA